MYSSCTVVRQLIYTDFVKLKKEFGILLWNNCQINVAYYARVSVITGDLLSKQLSQYERTRLIECTTVISYAKPWCRNGTTVWSVWRFSCTRAWVGRMWVLFSGHVKHSMRRMSITCLYQTTAFCFFSGDAKTYLLLIRRIVIPW